MPITQPYDVADYLTDDETILAYLEEALDTNEPRLITKAIVAIARARSRSGQGVDVTSGSLAVLSTVLRDGECADMKTIFEALSELGLKLTPALRQPAPLAA